MAYHVKDISLAEHGEKQVELAEMHMKGLMKIKERFSKEKPLSGIRVGMALHITKETAALVRTLSAGGADVAITGCNPLSTQDDVAAALAKDGFAVYGWKGETKEEYYTNLNKVLDFKPNITIDDGCDLVMEIHVKRQELLNKVMGGAEETTTGVIRLRSMEREKVLKYPVVAVNDSRTKHLFDNFIGTGQSTIDGILRATNTLMAGKNFVVSGYGNCGKGVAQRARGMGSNVIVTEVDPFKALQAVMDGFRVMPMDKVASIGDIFVTVTGNKHVIFTDIIRKMKSGAILANSGHFNIEIDIEGLEGISKKRRIRPFMDEYVIDGKKIFVLGEGRLINLAAAEGHPSEIMNMSFMNQSLAVEYIANNYKTLEPKVYKLPDEVDHMVAKVQLESMGIEIDELTDHQKKYLDSWHEGT
ncbi:MAG: adenosylhomocysteinase [Candidatus Aenigmarchaeota archaeon]|nr:adenosylhomocysteinase [Candidatus Aenigmarchaeota archaeon]